MNRAMNRIPLAMSVAAVIAGLSVVIGGLLILFSSQFLFDSLSRETQRRGLNVGGLLAEASAQDVLRGDAISAGQRLRRVALSDDSIEYVFLVDRNGRLFAHSFAETFPAEFRPLVNPDNASELGESFAFRSPSGMVQHVRVPLIEGVLGSLNIGFNREADNRRINGILWRIGGIATLVTLLGALLGLWAARFVTAPLRTLAEKLRGSIHGDDVDLAEIEDLGGSREVTELRNAYIRNVQRRTQVEQGLRESQASLFESQKFEAIGQLTGGVAHDFNNLLAIILGNLELVRDETDEAERADLLDTAIHAADRGADLTRQMLSFARRSELVPQELDLNAIVQSTKSWIGRTLPENIQVETSLLAGLWKIEADASLTESALLNLIVNARDAMPDGGRLTIETGNLRVDDEYVTTRDEDIEPGRYVMLAVSDTGVGMPEDILDHIYEPFFTTKAPGSGTGLGLSMVQGFMKQSGGTLRVYSEEGIGTTFKLFFRALEGRPDHEKVRPEVEDQHPEGSERLLVVEDDADVRRMLVTTLQRAGYEVVPAETGDAALALFERDQNFDLVVTDIVMPGTLQGTALAKKLREIATELPVVFLSGYASEATVHGNGLHPSDIRLTKPVLRSEFLKAIRKALSTR